MFDIGFAELLLVMVVGLLVIGPERLPETIRTLALWMARIKRQFNETKRDIEREIGADDIRRQIYNENIMRNLNESKQAIARVVDETNESISELSRQMHVDELSPNRDFEAPAEKLQESMPADNENTILPADSDNQQTEKRRDASAP